MRDTVWVISPVIYGETPGYIRLLRYTIAPEIDKCRLKNYISEGKIRTDRRCENVDYGSLGGYRGCDTIAPEIDKWRRTNYIFRW